MGILRFSLAICVLLYHIIDLQHDPALNGLVAVDAFFIISGFYMSLILENKYSKASFFTFISNRILRIYPLYWLIFFLTILFLFVSHYWGNISLITFRQYFSTTYVQFSTFLKEITLIIPKGYYYVASIHEPIVPSAWSLVIEMAFYIMAPFLIRRRNIFIITILILSFLIRYFVWIQQVRINGGYLLSFIPANICFFTLGILAHRMYSVKQYVKVSKSFFFLIAILIIQFFFWNDISNLTIQGIVVKEILFFLCMFLVIPTLFEITSKNRFDKFISNLSYPIYISHLLITWILQKTIFYSNNYAIYIVLSILFTILASILLYLYIDKPINQFRQWRINYLRRKAFLTVNE